MADLCRFLILTGEWTAPSGFKTDLSNSRESGVQNNCFWTGLFRTER